MFSSRLEYIRVMMELDFQHIDIEENKYIIPTLDILEHKIKQELPEESNIKIETPDNLDEIEFKNCNVKEEITEEICQDEDPLKVDELKDKIHDKLLKFSCQKCNKKYTTKFNLKEHERKVHVGGKLYHCKNIMKTCNPISPNYELELIQKLIEDKVIKIRSIKICQENMLLEA